MLMLVVYLAGITSLLLDTWSQMDIVFLSLSLCEIAFIFNSDMFVLRLTISSNFAIWLDLIPLISYNWSLTFFFSQNKSHTYNFTTIPKRHLNPNPKKNPPKSFNQEIPREFHPFGRVGFQSINPTRANPPEPILRRRPSSHHHAVLRQPHSRSSPTPELKTMRQREGKASWPDPKMPGRFEKFWWEKFYMWITHKFENMCV